MSKDVFLSIVIPVYNSEKSIPILVDKLEEFYRDRLSSETALINVGSKYSSGRIIQGLADKLPNIIAISLSRNFGQQNVIMAGFNHAIGDYIVTMGDDLQHPVEEKLKLVNCAQDNEYDAVYGEYHLVKNHSFSKNLGITFATIGFIAALIIILEAICLYHPLPGWPSLIVTLLIFS